MLRCRWSHYFFRLCVVAAAAATVMNGKPTGLPAAVFRVGRGCGGGSPLRPWQLGSILHFFICYFFLFCGVFMIGPAVVGLRGFPWWAGHGEGCKKEWEKYEIIAQKKTPDLTT